MMKNNKFILTIIAIILVLTSICTAFISCKEEEEPTPCEEHIDENGDGVCDACGEAVGTEVPEAPVKDEMIISDKLLVIDVHEQHQLTLVSGATDNDTWVSKQPEIATVDENGVVTGVSDGICEIQVSNDNGTLSCFVTVENSYTAPVLVLDNLDISLPVGDTYVIDPVLKYKGEDITDKVQIVIELADGAVSGVAQLTADGNKATLKAQTIGTTQYVVYTEYWGIQVSKTVNVTVKDFGLVFHADNLIPTQGGYMLNMSTYSVADVITSLVPDVVVYNGTQAVSDATVTYTTSDESVVKIENGALVAVANGTATVTGTYNGVSFNIAVSVDKPTINVVPSNKIVEVGRLSELVFDLELVGELADAKIDNVDVSDSITDGKLKLNRLKLETLPVSAYGDNVELVVETDKVIYKTTIDLYSLVIYNEADYRMIGEISKAAYASDPHMWGGYFVLGNNITVTGGIEEFIDRGGNAKGMSGGGDKGFCGVIDGHGYIIDGLSKNTNTTNAFVTALHKDGVIRNIGFTNAVFAAPKGAFLVYMGAGSIENVYIQYKEISNGNTEAPYYYSASIGGANGQYVVNNVLIDASNATVSGNGKYFHLISQSIDTFKNSSDNNYMVILPKDYVSATNTSEATVLIEEMARDKALDGRIPGLQRGIAFRSWEALKANETQFARLLKWDFALWHINPETGYVSFGKQATE